MQRQQVDSSNLKSIGYEKQVLEIEFQNGDVYQYFDVPKDEYIALMNAESHGKYFNFLAIIFQTFYKKIK